MLEGMFHKAEVAFYICVVWLSVGRLKPEERVNLAIGMVDVCVRVCADAVRDRYPAISEDEVIERVRERILYVKRRGRGV